MSEELELKEAKETLEREEYKLRWGGYTSPFEYITAAQYRITEYWRNRVKELETKK
jgi:hypothetical protein